MALVAVGGAHESLNGGDAAPGFFQMPEADAQMLSFSVYDLLKRIRTLREALYPAESAKAPILTLIRSRPDLSA
jgi:hypothetical protein